MRILNFNLTAFGPFTRANLDFAPNASGNPGLYLVYGPNEAGKSSALRGLTALLYGFEHQTSDNFIHPNNELQVSGTLLNSDGNRLEIRRRKGTKNTLLDSTGHPLDENNLKRFLGITDKQFFQTVFGIDHVRLREGGKEILAGSGRIGEALFAASTGITGLRQLAATLQQEAEELFKPRGSTQTIAKLKQQYKTIYAELETQTLHATDWQNHDTELHQATTRAAELQAELVQLQIEQTRLERIYQALPYLAQRQELLQQLEKFKDLIPLPNDFALRRNQAQQMLETAERELATGTHELERIDRELQDLKPNPTLLELGVVIEQLSQQSGQMDKYIKELPKLHIQLHEQEITASNLLQDLRPDLTLAQAESALRIPKAQRDGIRELGNRYGAIATSRTKAGADKLAAEAEFIKLNQELERLGIAAELSALKRSWERAQPASNLDDTVTVMSTKLAQEQKQVEIGLRRLWGWHNSLEQLEQIALPSVATVDIFQNEFIELTHQHKTLAEQLNTAQAHLNDCTRQLTELNLDSAVPTEAALQQARNQRDAGWQLIRRAWLDGERNDAAEAAYAPQQTLPEAYAHNVKIADDLADRLRREAARVQQQARAQADHVHYQQELAKFQQLLTKLQQQKSQLEQEWQQLWQDLGVTNRSPKEMRDWLAYAEKLRTQISALREDRVTETAFITRRTELLAELGTRLQELGESIDIKEDFTTRLKRVWSLIQKHERLAQERRHLESRISDGERRQQAAQQALLTAEQALTVWHQQWASAVTILGLNIDASPTQANVALEQIEQLFKALQVATTKREQIKHLETEIATYATAVMELCQRIDPDLTTQTPLYAIAKLNAKLQEARDVATRQKMLLKQAETYCNQLEAIRMRQNHARARFDACLREAHCTDLAALPVIETRSNQHRELNQDYTICRKRLLELSGGKGEAALLEESALFDADVVPSQIESIKLKIKELDLQWKVLHQTIGAKREVLKNYNGRSNAADQATELETVLTQLRSAGERYLRLRLANMVLKQQVEEYRQRHQTPLLSQASTIFARITGGAFKGLETAFSNTDQQVLRGLRAEGKPVLVEGMSDGTRDQLFLALRLASIQIYLEQAESMPLIIDDILIHSDDTRSQATLQVLAQLAQRTQVIMFTHHKHLLELANQAVAAGQVAIKHF